MGVLELSTVAEGVVTLTLNRPEKRNALSIELRDAVSDALDQVAVDEQVRVAVITGAGDVFSAGFDLSEFQVADQDFQKRLWASSDRFHRTCLTFPLPLVAAVNGPALAGGFDLAVMCDIRVATDTAVFSHPEQAWSDVVYSPLHDLVGGAVARDLCMTGRTITADEARRLNVVSRVVPPADLPAAVAEVTGAIARAPRANLLRTKAKALARARVSAGATLDL
ncbi:MAG TPA: enoyl-CoA hydratase/isomerase family protein [Thermoleophilia bacterium]|nr:enoyl-CoA hydratase/isomerase family protein [Thermoleophilia bacterium]